MVEVINVLSGKKEKVKPAELIYFKKRNTDYILSIPHGGILIPVEYEYNIDVKEILFIGMDSFTELLYDTGKGMIIASRINKHLVNVNRFKGGSKDKSLPGHLRLDPVHAFSLTGRKIQKKEFSLKEKEKILKFYDQYHSFIKKAIQEMKQKHGYALLFDCHSMASIGMKHTPDYLKPRPDFVIGTLDDTSAHPKIITAFHKTLKTEAEKSGLTVKKNNPYKGGFITHKYSNPKEKVHVIQLETKKANYMNEGLEDSWEGLRIKPKKFRKIKSIISKTIEAASKEAKKLYS